MLIYQVSLRIIYYYIGLIIVMKYMHERREAYYSSVTVIALKTEKKAVKISVSLNEWKTFF